MIGELLINNYGNYVIQKALSIAKGKDQYHELLAKIKENLHLLQGVSFGSKLFHKLLVQFPELNSMISQQSNDKRPKQPQRPIKQRFGISNPQVKCFSIGNPENSEDKFYLNWGSSSQKPKDYNLPQNQDFTSKSYCNLKNYNGNFKKVKKSRRID